MGKIRNPVLAGAYGLIFGIVGLYFAWVVDLWARTGRIDPVAFQPRVLVRYIAWFYEHGLWTISNHGGKGDTVSGIPLGIIWLVEAGVIVGFAAIMAYKSVAEVPFCEECNEWTKGNSRAALLKFNPAVQQQLAAGELNVLDGALGAVGGGIALHTTRSPLLSQVRQQHLPHRQRGDDYRQQEGQTQHEEEDRCKASHRRCGRRAADLGGRQADGDAQRAGAAGVANDRAAQVASLLHSLCELRTIYAVIVPPELEKCQCIVLLRAFYFVCQSHSRQELAGRMQPTCRSPAAPPRGTLPRRRRFRC